ncbi:MAG: hypothetical protein JWL70_600, partial [Acidimicrobiia bacterium]|nr:hypothetical protein [Acidimicrobiia bacterium]
TFKRTPVLTIKVDMANRTGERIESILRDNPLPERADAAEDFEA